MACIVGKSDTTVYFYLTSGEGFLGSTQSDLSFEQLYLFSQNFLTKKLFTDGSVSALTTNLQESNTLDATNLAFFFFFF